MYLLLFPIFILLYKIFKYTYKVYSFDMSELYAYNKSCERTTIFSIYGHTSFFDVPYLAWTGIRSGGIVVLAKKKYKWMYPKFCHKYILFIDSNTSKFQFEKNGALLIEGTRAKLPYIRSGFKYIAKNNNAQIVYWVNDYKENKLRLSKPLDWTDSDEILLGHLANFVETIPRKNYSLYPHYLSDIKLKKS